MLRPIVRLTLALALLMLVVYLPDVLAQTSGEKTGNASDALQAAPPAAEKAPMTFFGLVLAGGPVGFLILLLSVAAVALVIEHALNIRASVLIPPGQAEQIHEMLKGGHVAQAEQQCRLQPSFLAYILHAGISEIDAGWSVVEKAMEDTAAERAARLYRKIEYLSVIGNLAPMLGLLGTVIGMVQAFKTVADTQGVANVSDLAAGIYVALVTTVEGLIVAIPALAAFAFFRNKVEQLVAEASYVAQHVFSPLRRGRKKQPAPAPGGR